MALRGAYKTSKAVYPVHKLIAVLLFTLSRPTVACELPTSGVWVLDLERFVSYVSKGHKNAAPELRETFDPDDLPRWNFTPEGPRFQDRNTDRLAIIEQKESCILTLSEPSTPTETTEGKVMCGGLGFDPANAIATAPSWSLNCTGHARREPRS